MRLSSTNYRFAILVCFAMAQLNASVIAATGLPNSDSLSPAQVLTLPHYCEGIVFDSEGNGYVSHGSLVSKFSLDGKSAVWARLHSPNGHKILPDSTHLVCDANCVVRLSANGEIIEKAAAESEGKPLRAPNDLTLDKHKGFYFTDPADSTSDRPVGSVHYTDGNGNTTQVAEALAFPNGLVLTADAKRLIVAESKRNRLLAFEVHSPGRLGPPSIFAALPSKDSTKGQIDNQPDGICLDEKGNLYVAHYGMQQVHVYDPRGELLVSYNGGNLTTSNVAFGGTERRQLFLTGGLKGESGCGGLFRLDLSIRGLAANPSAN